MSIIVGLGDFLFIESYQSDVISKVLFLSFLSFFKFEWPWKPLLAHTIAFTVMVNYKIEKTHEFNKF